MKITNPLKSHRCLRLNAKLSVILCALALAGGVLSLGVIETSAQGVLRQIKRAGQQRKQERVQKSVDRQGGNKLAPADETSAASQPESATPKESARSAKHNLDGIRDRGIADFFRKEERELIIPGFGRPPAYLILLRQLDLTDEQKQSIKGVRQRIGPQLVNLRQQHNRLDQQLEEAIYGETYDPKRVEELAAQAGEKQAEITKLQAGIESQFRQILTADQFFVYRFLVGELLLPQRRQQPLLKPQQMQRRLNQQNRPNQQDPPQD